MPPSDLKILAFSASTRRASFNRKLLAESLGIMQGRGLSVTAIDLQDFTLPIYNADLEALDGMPHHARLLRHLFIDHHFLLIASPEYNGSLSPLLKNLIDWCSRDGAGGASREAFKGKKTVLMSASPSPLGGSRGLAHLRSILEILGALVLPDQYCVPSAHEAFDEAGRFKEAQKRVELDQFLLKSLS